MILCRVELSSLRIITAGPESLKFPPQTPLTALLYSSEWSLQYLQTNMRSLAHHSEFFAGPQFGLPAPKCVEVLGLGVMG